MTQLHDPPVSDRPSGGAPGRVLRVVGQLIGVGAALFVLGLILGLFVVGRHGGGLIQGWDNQVQTWEIHHRSGLVGASQVIAFFGDAPRLAVVCLVVTAALLVWRRSVAVLIPFAAYLGGEFQVFAIRLVVHRPRPPTAVFPAPGAVPGNHETTFSFPSGHSTAVPAIVFGLLGAAALARRWVWPWLVAALLAAAVAESRLALGVHWFSDVTVGLLLGATWGIVVAVVSRRVAWADLVAVLARVTPGRRRP